MILIDRIVTRERVQVNTYFNSKYEVLYQDPSWLQTAAQPRKLIRIRYEDLGEHSSA